MKIKLIAPARKPAWGEGFWDLKTLCKLTGRKAGGAPLALPTLAALTPPDVEVVLTDENVEPVNFEEKVDLVGITGMTCLIPRAYEIADEYRKRAVPVVMGGIHASMLPEEAIQHCDAVVIGETEGIWEQVVRDTQKNNLQKIYRANGFPDLTNAPTPRWDLLKNDKYCYFTIQTGRGCPYDCEFCSVKVFNGRQYRHKRIEQVIREVETLKKIDSKKLLFFTDDNILAIPKYTEELLKELAPLKIKAWWCQSSINRLKDDKILDLMNTAGCRVVFIGFESVSQKSLDLMSKSQVNKVEEYKEIVNNIHAHRIAVFGSFVLGSDSDDENIFNDTAKFIDETNIAFSMINIMTPLPGSELYKRLKNENRILCQTWERYQLESVCFLPKLLSVDKLKNKFKYLIQQVYSYKALYKRLNFLWKRKIYAREDQARFFTRGRLIFSFISLLNKETNRIIFILTGLWHPAKTSISSIITALAFHDYAYNYKEKPILTKISYKKN